MSLQLIISLTFFVASVRSYSQEILQNYQKEGLESNLQVIKLESDYFRSLAAVREVSRQYGPKINVIGRYDRNFRDGIELNDQQGLGDLIEKFNAGTLEDGILYIPPKNLYQGGLQVTQPIYNPKITAQKKIYEAKSDASKANINDFKIELNATIAQAYFQYIQSLSIKNVIKKGLALSEKNLSNIEKSLAVNKTTKDAFYKAKSNVEDVKKQLQNIENTIENSQYYFNFLLNRDLQSKILIDRFYKFDPNNNYQVFRQNQRLSSYKLETIEYNQKALKAEEKLITTNHLPQLNLNAFGGIQGVEIDFDNERLKMAQINLSLSWNIFDSGMTKAKKEQNFHDQISLQAQHELKEQELQMKDLQLYGNVETHLKNYGSIKSNYKNAKIYYETIYKKYQLGSASILELTEAQSELLAADKEQINWYYELYKEAVNYQKETGKELLILQ